MNREIKFRAWHKINKTMLYGKDISVLAKNIKDDNVLGYMQFVGLCDKNGKEIYEGDILSFKFWNKEGIGCVSFQNGAFGISTYIKHIQLYAFNPFCSYDEPEKDCYPFIEVVGSIYENPELTPNL